MPSLDWPTPLKNLASKGRDIVGGAGDILSSKEKYALAQVRRAAELAGDIPGPSEDLAAAGLTRMESLGGLGEVGIGLLAIGSIRDGLKLPFRLLPSWIANPARGAIDWFFQPYTNLENYVISNNEALMGDLIPGWHTFMDYLLPKTQTIKELQTQAQPGSPTFAGVQTEIRKLQTLSDYQQREIDYLKSKVGGTAPGVTITQQTIVQVPPTLEAQIQAVQSRLTQLSTDLGTVDAKTVRNAALISTLQADVATLNREIGGIRSTVASWPDVQAQLQQTMFEISAIQSAMISDIQHHTAQLTALAPLLLLMEPGIAGLDVLRHLEDTPCMCPHLPGLPNELGALLAAYEFATHG